MAEYFPGYTPEASSDDDDDSNDSKEKKSTKKVERKAAKEHHADDKAEKRDREEAVSVEKLTSDETSAIAVELARLRAEAAKQELVDATDGSVEQTEVIPVVEFDEALQENLEAGQSFDEAMENAEATATELLGDDIDIEAPDESAVDDAEIIETPDDDAEERVDDDATTGSTPPAGGAGTPPPGGGGAPAGPTGPAGPGALGGPGGAPNILITPPTPNIAPAGAPERQSAAPYLLAGGLVGYLIGRRRGRIKTERRLGPIQKKLEKQVVDLENQIVLREEKIRKLTRKQAEKQSSLQAEMAERKHAQKTEISKSPESSAPRQATSEKIGKIAFRPEAPTRKSQEIHTKSVDSMNITELLVVAERLKVESGNAKRLFETGRLDEKGLRRVLKAYLSGKAFENILHEELRSNKVEGIEQDPDHANHKTAGTANQSAASNATTSSYSHAIHAEGVQPYAYGSTTQDSSASSPQPNNAGDTLRSSGNKKQTITLLAVGVGVLLVILFLVVF